MEQTAGQRPRHAGWGHGTLPPTRAGPTDSASTISASAGIGYSKLSAHGNVFALTKLEDFAGLYGIAQAGAVAATDQLHGGIWLQTSDGRTDAPRAEPRADSRSISAPTGW